MKRSRKRLDILILLGSLLILSMGIGILYAELNVEQSAVLKGKKPFATDQEIINVLSANFSARNVREIGGLISRAPFEQQVRLLEKIIKNENIGLNRDDKLELLLYLAAKTRQKKNQDKIFNLLLENPIFLAGTPVLYHAAAYHYENSIPALLTWLETKPDKKTKWIMDGFAYAIQENKPGVVQILFEQGVPISSAQATQLLWQAIMQNKNEQFASLFAKKGARLNDSHGGVTPLIAAVKTGNLPMVKALLDNGARINLIKDPGVGSALQNAIRKSDTPIELLLRTRGARE